MLNRSAILNGSQLYAAIWTIASPRRAVKANNIRESWTTCACGSVTSENFEKNTIVAEPSALLALDLKIFREKNVHICTINSGAIKHMSVLVWHLSKNGKKLHHVKFCFWTTGDYLLFFLLFEQKHCSKIWIKFLLFYLTQ